MGIKKQFSNMEDIKKLGKLLRIADIALQESLVISINSLNNTDKLIKRIQNINYKISKLRSDIDNDLIRIMEQELYRSTENKELNKLIYPDIDNEKFIESLS